MKLDQNGPEEDGTWVHCYTGFGTQADAVGSGKCPGWVLLRPHLAEGEHVKD